MVVQWRPELVRHVCGETAHLFERFLEPPEGLVEDARQPPHLVIRVVRGQPVAQPLAVMLRALGHLFDGGEPAPAST